MDIFLQGMRDRSRQSGAELAQEIQLTDLSTAGNLSNWSSRVQIPRDICTRLKRYLYSAKCSWIITLNILKIPKYLPRVNFAQNIRIFVKSPSLENITLDHPVIFWCIVISLALF